VKSDSSIIFGGDFMGLFGFLKPKPSAAELQEAANRQLAAEDLSQYKVIHTTLVDVTLTNPDGSERQQVIRGLRVGDALQVKTFKIKGVSAMFVLNASGQIAGHLSLILAERLTEEYQDARILAVVHAITGGEAGESLGCDVDLYV
jgi:hypothetical protein